MQSSPINAAQLMMEFLNKEQTDIGQEIVASEFSRELENQQLKLGETARRDARPCSQEKSNPACLQPAAPIKSPRADADSASANGTTRKLETLKRIVSDEEPQKDDCSQIAQEMLLSNPGHLEKVLADLKVPAEVRKVCKSSEDKQGRVTLHDLLTVLEQQTTSSSILIPGRTAGQDVATLIHSVVVSDGREVLNVEKLIKKPNGAYTLDELRQVIEKAVEQIRTNRLARSAVSPESSGSAASSRLSTSTLEERYTSTAARDQSSHLVNSTIPSFLEEIVRNKEKDQQEVTASPDIRVRNPVEISVPESRAESPAGKINTSERELPPALTTESADRRLEPAMSQFSSPGKIEITEDNSHNPIQALVGIFDHQDEVSLRAVGDILKGFVGEATASVVGQSTPVDILEQFQVVLPFSPEGIIKGKIWPTASEPVFASSKIKEYFAGLPWGDDQPQTSTLHLFSSASASEKTMSSMNPGNNALKSGALPEGYSRMLRNNRTHSGILIEDNSVEELKAFPAASRMKTGMGKLVEHPTHLTSAVRQVVGELNGEKPALASLATTMENQPSTSTRAASGHISEVAPSLKGSAGQGTDTESIKVSAKSIQTVSLTDNAVSEPESIPKIQTAEYLSRLDGIPLEAGRRFSAWNRNDPSQPMDVGDGRIWSESIQNAAHTDNTVSNLKSTPGVQQVLRDNRTHPEVAREEGLVEEVKASPSVGSSKTVVGKLADHPTQQTSAAREAVGEIDWEKPALASLANTMENQPSTSRRAASEQLSEAAPSLKGSLGRGTDTEIVKVSAKSIQAVSPTDNAVSEPESISKIQTAEYLSRLDGIPMEAGRRFSAWNQVDPSQPEMPSIGSEEFSKSAKNDLTSPPSQQAERAPSQSIQAASGSAFEHAHSDGGRSSTPFTDTGDSASTNYPSFMQNTSTAGETGMQFRGQTISMLHPSWTHEMVQVIQNLVKGKRTSQLTLELEPRDLGHLTLRVGTSSEEVTAYVSAEKEQAREILLRNVSALRQQLEDQGLTLGRFMVDVQDGRQDGGHYPGRGFHESSPVSPLGTTAGKETDQPDSGFQTIKSSEQRLISLFA